MGSRLDAERLTPPGGARRSENSADPRPRDAACSITDVAAWLREIGLAQYAARVSCELAGLKSEATDATRSVAACLACDAALLIDAASEVLRDGSTQPMRGKTHQSLDGERSLIESAHALCAVGDIHSEMTGYIGWLLDLAGYSSDAAAQDEDKEKAA